MSESRRFFVGGNHKMNGDTASLSKIAVMLSETQWDKNVEVVVAPPTCYISTLVQHLSKTGVSVSAQNIHEYQKGAFTGEISASMVVDCGATYTILGHSERRHVFGEGNEQIGQKTATALAQGLTVIACIGEQLEERQAGKTMDVCISQLTAFKDNISDWSKVVIAYEPVWAIGTGKVATPEQAQEVHAKIRNWLSENVSSDVAGSVRIIYGGSVNAGNCGDLSLQRDIDGFLVGGASLKLDFIQIINCQQ